MLVVCVLVSIIMFAGCKKQEPAATEAPATPEVPEVTAPPEVVEEAAKEDVVEAVEKIKANADKAAEDPDAVMAAVQAMIKAATEQTKCPVMGGDINKSVFTTYKDKKVYFCCKACIAKFEAEPEKYLSKLPQFQQ